MVRIAGHEYRISKGGRNAVAKRQNARHSEKREEQALRLMNREFLDGEEMDSTSPLDCSKHGFKEPKLRKCPFGLGSMDFVKRVGGGLDGYNWNIQGPRESTYILKLFWDTEPWVPHYFAAQRECQNAALFQLIEAALSDAAGPKNGRGPILLNPKPKSKPEALANLYAFSNEARQENIGVQSRDLLPSDSIMTRIPRMRKCYGWLQFTGRELRDRWSQSLRPHSDRSLGRLVSDKFEPPHIEVDKIVRSLDDAKLYTAVVYEFIEEAENDDDAVKLALDYFWLLGFSHSDSPKAANWKHNVLVDGSDIVSPGSYGWKITAYGERLPKSVLIK